MKGGLILVDENTHHVVKAVSSEIDSRGGSRIRGRGGGGAAATASTAGAKVFGGSRLKTLFGISKGGRRALRPPPPESASGFPCALEGGVICNRSPRELKASVIRNWFLNC